MVKASLNFRSWNLKLGEAAKAARTARFPARLEAVLQLVAPFDMMNGFCYADERAFDLHNAQLPAQRKIIVEHYLAGSFILDPFYDAIKGGTREQVLVMQDLAPDQFLQSEYYETHYRATGIIDEIGFVLHLSAEITGILSLTRQRRSAPFSPIEIVKFREAAPIICALGEQHWRDHAMAPRQGVSTESGPTDLQRHGLTGRQIEIVLQILKGHSTPSISLQLGLSPTTVKVHRRNIYSKLKISSQAELFRMFMARLH
jgi:DNA-binding CsgD family transcriptional regulator